MTCQVFFVLQLESFMGQPIDKIEKKEAATDNATDAPLTIQPSWWFGEQNPYPPKPDQKTNYHPDGLESLCRFNKLMIGLGIIFILIHASQKTGKPVEFFIGSLVGLCLLIVAAAQYYAYKRGLFKTDNLLAQNERIITTIGNQAKSMEGQLNAMKKQQDSWAITERAYIGVKNIRLVEPLAIDRDPIVKVIILNGGRTPAWNVMGNIKPFLNNFEQPSIVLDRYISELEAPGEKLENQIELTGQTGLLPAGEPEEYPETLLINLVQGWASVFNQIEDGTMPFYLGGRVKYADFQGRHYSFEFLTFYEKSIQGFTECLSRTVTKKGKAEAKTKDKGKNPN